MRLLATTHGETTGTSDARRAAGIDRRTVGPALLVLALAVLMSVVLPSIDGATSYRDQVDKGDVAALADGLTLVPATGWELATGALVGHTRSPVGTTATTEVVDGSVEFQVQAAPLDGTPSALLTRVNKINSDLEHLQGSAAARSRRYAVRTRRAPSVSQRTSRASTSRGRSSPSCSAPTGRRPAPKGSRAARAWRSSPPAPRPRYHAGATPSSR